MVAEVNDHSHSNESTGGLSSVLKFSTMYVLVSGLLNEKINSFSLPF